MRVIITDSTLPSVLIGTVVSEQPDAVTVRIGGEAYAVPLNAMRRLDAAYPRNPWNGLLAGGEQGLFFGAAAAPIAALAALTLHNSTDRETAAFRVGALTLAYTTVGGALLGAFQRAVRWKRLR